MKLNKFYILLLTLSLFSCVEKYEFSVDNDEIGIVIEAFISNKSYTNTVEYPSDGRYFKVKIKHISNVTNVADSVISYANVRLLDNQNNIWNYIEDWNNPGEYKLTDPNFKSIFGVKYKIQVTIPSGEKFESSWETMPVENTILGKTSIEQTSIHKYTWIDEGEKEIRPYPGINVSVKLNENISNDNVYYRWDYEPLWIYIAPFADDDGPVKKCWVTSDYYLNHFTLEEVNKGNYDKNLFFIETKGNNKVYEYFSVLIKQKAVSKDYYHYHKELIEQSSNAGGIYAQPPFNLKTNFTCTEGDAKVVGYFGVYTENATRWVFNKHDLDYGIYNDVKEICEPMMEFPVMAPTPCTSCLKAQGDAKNSPPWWWNEN